jgi:hypothetical protein
MIGRFNDVESANLAEKASLRGTGLVGGGAGRVQSVPEPTDTVQSALAYLEDLNRRLTMLSVQVGQVALVLGGSAQGSTDDQEKTPAPGNIVQALHMLSGTMHRRAAEIEQSLQAIFSALGLKT